jgi:hypothetical protein
MLNFRFEGRLAHRGTVFNIRSFTFELFWINNTISRIAGGSDTLFGIRNSRGNFHLELFGRSTFKFKKGGKFNYLMPVSLEHYFLLVLVRF